MSLSAAKRRYVDTRALGKGEARVRFYSDDRLLFCKIGCIHGGTVTVEWLGRRYSAVKSGQQWRLDVDKLGGGGDP